MFKMYRLHVCFINKMFWLECFLIFKNNRTQKFNCLNSHTENYFSYFKCTYNTILLHLAVLHNCNIHIIAIKVLLKYIINWSLSNDQSVSEIAPIRFLLFLVVVRSRMGPSLVNRVRDEGHKLDFGQKFSTVNELRIVVTNFVH